MDRRLVERVVREGRWYKASASEGTGGCVEVAPNVPGVAGVRDSKDPGGPVLVFDRQAFAQFVEATATGRFSA